MLCCPCCLKHYMYIANTSRKLSRSLLIRSKGASFMHTTVCRGRCRTGAATFHCESLHASPGKIFILGLGYFERSVKGILAMRMTTSFTQAKVIFSGHRSIQRTLQTLSLPMLVCYSNIK